MSKRLFGTDGVRGIANEKLTPELAFQIGQAAGRWLRESGQHPRVVMGRDTRKSGPMIGASLASGFCSAGVDVDTLGIVPTGCVSWAAMTGEYGLGAVISASHNPAPDNGIKLIGSDGRKVAEETERWIEGNLGAAFDRPTGNSVGMLEPSFGLIDSYLDWLVALVPEGLQGMTVAMDCGDGAAYELAPRLFERLGARVVSTGISPNGTNINAQGGATKPETIQSLASSTGADIGIAFDGDADRAVFSDDQGRLINGDRTMAIWCAHWSRSGGLDPALVVGTVMTNGGFEQYMLAQGVNVHRTDVGDKYVSARLRETGGKIGGEQSGHIIFSDVLPTGDGLVTALQVVRVLKREGRRASDFFGDYESWPQLLVNVSVKEKDGWESRPKVSQSIASGQEALQSHGRLNVRPSGTQPMLRVMVEADNYELRDRVSKGIVQAMIEDLGGEVYSTVDLTHALGD
ncbi:MAG: phosphoglucosamine mutase [Armatimonadetes bacterium]|nr:phosphoglucosamine mutase [Armatimonadota bacterium]